MSQCRKVNELMTNFLMHTAHATPRCCSEQIIKKRFVPFRQILTSADDFIYVVCERRELRRLKTINCRD